MMVYRRPASLYRWSSFLLSLILALALNATAFGGPFKTEIVGPRTMTMRGPDGRLKTVHEEAVAGQVLVELRADVTQQQFQAVLNRRNGTVLRAIPRFRQYVVSLPEGMSVLEGRAMWAAEAEVRLAEPDRLMYLAYTPNDPLYGNQYQWDRTYAPAAWDVQQGAATTIIAIIDSGYDADHEDLVGKWWVNTDEVVDGTDTDGNGYIDDVNGWDFVQDDNDPDAAPVSGETYSPGQVNHGMHCAGLAGAVSDNGIGVAGFDWGAQMMPLRVFPPDGGATMGAISAAIAYAIDNGADIISMSIQGGFTPAYDTPIAQAHAAGIVVVAAAGNFSVVFNDDPSTWFSPVCNDGPNLGEDNFVLGVGATDANDVAADFTNRDASSYNFVDVMAPGVDTWSTYYYDPSILGLEALYGPMSGTSMSCPMTAGLAGLVVAQFPSFTPDEIVNQIRASCDNIDDLNPLYAGTLGQGRINAAGAIGLDVPPEPVTSLQAFDTPGDEGGSITVTWTVSRQDTVDVVGYDLLRAEEDMNNPGNPGPFAPLATLPPGTNGYIDTPIDDDSGLINYWYRVDTRDASNTVPSEIAGPAAARDDLAPPPIENLFASDTQADLGGSISLSWFGYNFPDDLDHYNIYRATQSFTDISAMTPIDQVLPDAGQYYTDVRDADETDPEDGTDYWYAVTGVDDHDNEERLVTAVGPATANPNFAFSFLPGTCIMALGAVPAGSQSRNLGDIFGVTGAIPAGFNIAYYDRNADPADPYILYSAQPASPVFDQALGRAWWLKTGQPILVNMSGQPAPPGDFTVDVAAGWNMIGNPFSEDLDFSLTKVQGIGQGTPATLQESNQLGFTRDYAWGFDATNNSYKLVSGADLPFATKTVGRGRGVFFLAQRGATLVLKRPAAAAANQPRAAAEPFDGWQLQLIAAAEGLADTDNFCGVSSRAAEMNNIVSPPRPDADLDLYFVADGAQQTRNATDFVTSLAERDEWRIRVACDMPGATVRLSWPDLSRLPADCRPVLTDEATGRSVYLRTSAGYSYEVGEQPTERSFTLKLTPAGSQTLAVAAMSASAAAGRAQVVYALSEDATVDLEILNIAGLRVRRILAGTQQAAGTQQVVWDGKNASGAPVPSGTYLVRLCARADDGQQVSVVRALQMGR